MGLPVWRTNNPNWRPPKPKTDTETLEKANHIAKEKLHIDLFWDPKMADIDPNSHHLSKYNLETVNRFLSIIRVDWTIEQAETYAWINHTTYIDWRRQYPDFVDAVNRARNFMGIAALNTVAKEIVSGSSKDAWEYLKRRDDRYIDKTEKIEEKKLTLEEWQFKMIFSELNKLKDEGKLTWYIEAPETTKTIDSFNSNKKTIFTPEELNWN